MILYCNKLYSLASYARARALSPFAAAEASIRKTLRNRGENDFGMVLGRSASEHAHRHESQQVCGACGLKNMRMQSKECHVLAPTVSVEKLQAASWQVIIPARRMTCTSRGPCGQTQRTIR